MLTNFTKQTYNTYSTSCTIHLHDIKAEQENITYNLIVFTAD